MPFTIDQQSLDGLPKRRLAQALWRGFRCRCPKCGEGALFRGYVKSLPACAKCGEDLSHQRADDAPPYFTIVAVGHIIVPLMVVAQLATDFPAAVYLAVWLPLTAALAVLLLRPIKGAVIAMQWALYMHGFDGITDAEAPPEAFGPVSPRSALRQG